MGDSLSHLDNLLPLYITLETTPEYRVFILSCQNAEQRIFTCAYKENAHRGIRSH